MNSINVKTRIKAGGTQHATTLAVDWTGATLEMLKGPALDSLVITWQGRQRRKGVIPKTDKIVVKDFIASLGQRSTFVVNAENVGAVAQTMSAEERKVLIAKLQEMDKLGKAA